MSGEISAAAVCGDFSAALDALYITCLWRARHRRRDDRAAYLRFSHRGRRPGKGVAAARAFPNSNAGEKFNGGKAACHQETSWYARKRPV